MKNIYINIWRTKKGLILEAGCGVGDKVYQMHYNGYNVVGIDFAKNTIARTKRVHPELILIIGDINHLPFKSNTFEVIWCIGVIEHLFHGFDEIIFEMYKVLKKNSILFLSFPTLSPIRKFKVKLGLYQPVSSVYENSFYQYAYDEDIVKEKVEEYGFKNIENSRYDGIKGLKDEIIMIKPILQKIYDSHYLTFRIFKYILNAIINPISGHMCLMVFRKT